MFISGTGPQVPVAVIVLCLEIETRICFSYIMCRPHIPPALYPWGCSFASDVMGHFRQALCNEMNAMNKPLRTASRQAGHFHDSCGSLLFFLQYLMGLSHTECYLFMGMETLRAASKGDLSDDH